MSKSELYKDAGGLVIEVDTAGNVYIACPDASRVGNFEEGKYRFTIFAPIVELTFALGAPDEEALMKQILGIIPHARPGTDLRTSNGEGGKVKVAIWGPGALKKDVADLAGRLMGALKARGAK